MEQPFVTSLDSQQNTEYLTLWVHFLDSVLFISAHISVTEREIGMPYFLLSIQSL